MVAPPTIISLFAGCGGSSLGYRNAGFDEKLAVEIDKHATQVFCDNFPEVPTWSDINTLSGSMCMELSGLSPGELDVLDGSPPCQGFSTAGLRKSDDPRNKLFEEYIRLVRFIKPRVLVMENVTGLVAGKMRATYTEIIRTLSSCGYFMSGEMLNAVNFGVPQKRRRVIIIGTRNDLKIKPTHPLPMTKPAGCIRLDDRPALYSKRRWGDTMEREGYPVRTITKMGRMFWNQKQEFGQMSYSYAASFPSDFRWTGSFNDVKSRIGNSVPPGLMFEIAKHIRLEILNKP